jgi:hypothetical protein
LPAHALLEVAMVVFFRSAARGMSVGVLCLLGSAIAWAGPAPTTAMARVRGLTRDCAELVDDALARSTVVSDLVARLSATDVVVFVSRAHPKIVPTAELMWVGSGPGIRYLKIRIGQARMSRDELIEWLAHELQHAVEVASCADVRDLDTFERLFHRIGVEWKPGRFETAAAVQVQESARRELELLRAHRPTTAPVTDVTRVPSP